MLPVDGRDLRPTFLPRYGLYLEFVSVNTEGWKKIQIREYKTRKKSLQQSVKNGATLKGKRKIGMPMKSFSDLSWIDCFFDDNVYRNGFTFLFIWQLFPPFCSASWNNETTDRPYTFQIQTAKARVKKEEKKHNKIWWLTFPKRKMPMPTRVDKLTPHRACFSFPSWIFI